MEVAEVARVAEEVGVERGDDGEGAGGAFFT